MKNDQRQALEELARRKAAQQGLAPVIAGIRAELFDKQLAFVDDESRNKAALCTRRAGKTNIWPRYAPMVCLLKPRSLVRIWGINRLRAKQLLWDDIKLVCARHKVEIVAHETELTIRFDNGSEIRLLGADKDKEAQKKRGDKTTLEIVLETQLFGPYLRKLVEEVIEPCLFDTKGTVCLEGTPGPVPTGYWYWVTGGSDTLHRWQSEGMMVATGGRTDSGEPVRELVGAGWSIHQWSLLDNPHLPHAREEMERLKKRRSWTDDTPSYRREYLGRWVRDDGVLFYKYNEGRNGFSLAVIQPWGPGWTHVLGWDLGSVDDMALAVWGWHPSHRELFQAAEWKKPGASAEEVVEQIEKWERQGFNFIAKVADTGGGGRMYVEQVMRRTSQVFEPAKKNEKLEHVRLMNDDFLSGRLRVQIGGEYAGELSALPKDPDWDPDSGKPPGEDPRFANHLCDAHLYSWRYALNYLDFSPEEKPESHLDRMEREEEERIERISHEREQREWWEPDGDAGDLDA